MSEAEAVLEGRSPDEERLRLAGRQISERMIRQSGVRPSTSYKKPVVEALFIRAMRRALEGLT
jgi:CO/xanthine dehydrogenase FAD-binding subunit